MAELVLGLKKFSTKVLGTTKLFAFYRSLVPSRRCKECTQIVSLLSSSFAISFPKHQRRFSCSLDLSHIVTGSVEMGAQI